LIFAAAIAWLLEHVVPFGGSCSTRSPAGHVGARDRSRLAALATGGRFDKLEIFADASGLAHTARSATSRVAVTCLGGMLAPPLVGAKSCSRSHAGRGARVSAWRRWRSCWW